MSESLEDYVSRIRGSFREEHYELGSILLAVDQTLYYPDMYIIAGMNRSLSLMRGFVNLIVSRNYTSAAPLVRLQLDNALRAAALAMVENPHEFAIKILEGEQINRMKDRWGEKMTDLRLRTQVSRQWPWINDIYEQGSGYIHFSDKHILMTFKSVEGEPAREFRICEDNEQVPDRAYRLATDAFAGGTFAFLRYVEAWIREKQRIVADRDA